MNTPIVKIETRPKVVKYDLSQQKNNIKHQTSADYGNNSNNSILKNQNRSRENNVSMPIKGIGESAMI